MTQSLLALDLSRGQSRARFFFANALAAGAFTSTGYYAAVSTDGLGANPTNVVAVFAVAGNSAAVELALEPALVAGSVYQFSFTALPNADLSTFTGSILGSQGAAINALPNIEPASQDLDLLLYSRDLVHNGVDFVESPAGDLLTATGRPNWLGAVMRRMTSNGVGWDPTYGAKANQYVNAPDAYKQPLAGSLASQARADNRTQQATVAVIPYPGDPNLDGWIFQMTITGQDGLDPTTINIPPTVVGA